MRALVVDNGSLTTHLIARRAGNLGWDAVIVRHDALDIARAARDWDAVLLSGTDVPVTTGRFDAQFELVRNCTAPLMGICGGLHLIGRAYGVGIVEQQPVLGRTEVFLDSEERLFSELPAPAQIFQRHSYRLERVPCGFRRIATSSSCPVEAIAHETRALFGLQGHVELRADGARILERFLSLAV
jgi:GMP synthase (glutamine-hydrolysing)